MRVVPGIDPENMAWWPDLLALIREGSTIREIIGKFPPNFLMSFDRGKLFQIIEREFEDGKNTGDLSWSSLIAKDILLIIAPAVEDELLEKYEVLFGKKDYAGSFLFWIHLFLSQLREIKKMRKREAEFFEKYPGLIA
ncbi:MAG: hypothetical protein PHO56_01140 [Patescibacteria group bacterium]|nr:hypothetical protein [Patescibacteria group bacterium]